MSRSSFVGYIRQYGSTKKATPAVFKAVAQFTMDPTVASAGIGVFLPKGAIPVGVQVVSGGATGGTDPDIDIGVVGDADGFAADIAADTTSAEVVGGGLFGVELLIDTEISAGVGASAATGGSVIASVSYIMADDGKDGSKTA